MSVLVDLGGDAHTLPGPWHTLADIIVAHKAHRWHWFDRDEATMRLVERRIHGGRLFVSSERYEWGQRHWTIKVAGDDGAVSDWISGSFGTSEDAHLAAWLGIVASERVT